MALNTPASDGLYLQVYPSSLVNASRMGKIGRSIQATRAFRETHLVGVTPTTSPRTKTSGAVCASSGSVAAVVEATSDGCCALLLWQPRVFLHYRKQRFAVVAAHNVWVLPMCWLLSRRTGAHLVYNAHELETETAAMKGLKQQAAKLIESRLIRRCAMVSVVNEPIAEWYESAYRHPATGRRRQRAARRGRRGARCATSSASDPTSCSTSTPDIWSADATSRSSSRPSPARRHHVVFLGDGPYREAVAGGRRRSPERSTGWLRSTRPHRRPRA